MKRPILALAAIAAVAGCVELPQATGAASQPTTTFTHKSNTPLQTRAFDITSCEAEARGLSLDATPAQAAEANARLGIAVIAQRSQDCVRRKGYTVTQKPVCSDADYARGQAIRSPNVLPPLDSIICLDPSTGTMVTTAAVQA